MLCYLNTRLDSRNLKHFNNLLCVLNAKLCALLKIVIHVHKHCTCKIIVVIIHIAISKSHKPELSQKHNEKLWKLENWKKLQKARKIPTSAYLTLNVPVKH